MRVNECNVHDKSSNCIQIYHFESLSITIHAHPHLASPRQKLLFLPLLHSNESVAHCSVAKSQELLKAYDSFWIVINLFFCDERV